MAQYGRGRESYPPPLFVAELDASAPGSGPAHSHGPVCNPTGPDGQPVFEMAAEAPPLPTHTKPAEGPSPHTWADGQASLGFSGSTRRKPAPGSPGSHEATSPPSKQDDVVETPQSPQANPWPYHGPPLGVQDEDPAPTKEQPEEITLWPRPASPARVEPFPGHVPDGVPSGYVEPEAPSKPTLVPGPLAVPCPHSTSTSASVSPGGAPIYKPYSPSPPPGAAIGSGAPAPHHRPNPAVSPGPRIPKTHPTTAVPYKAYHPSVASSSAGSSPVTSPVSPEFPQGRFYDGAAPHHFMAQPLAPPSHPSPASPPASTSSPPPARPQAQYSAYRPPEPPAANSRPHSPYNPNLAPSKPPATSSSPLQPVAAQYMAPSAERPTPTSPPDAAATYMNQSSHSAYFNSQNTGSSQGQPTYFDSQPTGSSQGQGSPRPNQPYHASSPAPLPGSVASPGYGEYLPSPPPGRPSPTPLHQGAMHHHPSNAPISPPLASPHSYYGPTSHSAAQSPPPMSPTSPPIHGAPSSGHMPQSPPPPYTYMMPIRPGQQPISNPQPPPRPATGNTAAHHPSQPPRPANGSMPSYHPRPAFSRPENRPPSAGSYSHSLHPPPPLPPRPASAHDSQPPMSGFGSAAPVNFPPPPKANYTPGLRPPNHSAGAYGRPDAGKLFSGSQAKKWFDKTGQALESTLSPYLQGDPRYRVGQQGHGHAPYSGPSNHQGRPPQQPHYQGQPMQSYPAHQGSWGRGPPPPAAYPGGPPGAYPQSGSGMGR